MRRYLGVFFGIALAHVGLAQQYNGAQVGAFGGSTSATVSFNNYVVGVGWTVSITLTGNTALYPNGTTYDTEQQANWGGVVSCNLGSLNGIGTVAALTTNNFVVTNHGGNNTQSVTSPAAPPVSKAQTLTGTNQTSVGLMIGLKDTTSGDLIDSSFQYVGPGQAYNVSAQSNGDNLELVAISQTQAQFDSFSSVGTGAYDGSGNLISGTLPEIMNLYDVPYNQMTATTPGDNSGTNNPSGTSPTNVIQAATNSSGAPVPNTVQSTGGSGATTPGAPTVVAFQSGTGAGQTGNTSAATNGVLAQVGNVVIQGDASIVAAIQAQESASSGSSSTTVSGTVAVSNFPTNFPDSAAISALGTANSSLTGIGTALTTTNADLSSIGTTLTSIKTDADSLVSNTTTIAEALGGVSGYDGGSSEVAAEYAAGSSLAGDTSFGLGIAPTSPGTAGSASFTDGYPADIAIDSALFPSGMSMPTAFSWVSAGQVWSTADGYLKNARPLLALFECVMFAMSCGRAMREYVVGLAATNASPGQFAAENIIFGVPQAKTIAMATAFVTVLAGFIAAILALITGSLSGVGGTAVSAMTAATDLSGMGPGIGLINQYVPVSLTVSLLLLRGVMDFWMAPVFAAAASVIRFISL